MKTTVLGLFGMSVVLAGTVAVAQQAPTSATYITKEQVDAVNAAPGTDRQIQVLDMGKYQFAVGIIHRGPTGGAARGAAPAAGAAASGAAAGGGQGRGAAPAGEPCGMQGTAPTGPNVASGIAHDSTTEGYYIVSGSGTLVTGGHIMNGRRSGPDSEVTKVLNGPSCSGVMAGSDVVSRAVKTGDIIVIPAGVPHGWTNITDHVDYLSFRPDPDKVLAHGYTHPAMPKQ
jgi:mannose-6-phosphate isomerase-like protein (cupin superfamily)